jgi:hypothetical protein
MTNYSEVSPYTNPESRLGAICNFDFPKHYSGANGTERTIVLASSEGTCFIYGGPIDKQAEERYSAIEINGVPASIPNAEMIRLFQKCIFRHPFGGKRHFFTFEEFMGARDCLAGYMIEN